MKTPVSRRAFLKFGSGAVLLAGAASLPGCGSSHDLFPVPDTGGNGGGPFQPQVLNQQILEFGADGTAYRLDSQTFTVARLNSQGEVVWEVGGLGDGSGLFNFPVALATDSNGLIYVADRGNGEIDVLDERGNLVRTFGDESLFIARDMALDPQRGRIYVADGPNHQVIIFDLVGNLLGRLGQFGTENSADLNFPSGVALGLNGELHVVDSGNAEVHVYSAENEFLRAYGSRGSNLGQFTVPRAVVVDGAGHSWVADGVAGYVTGFDPSGIPITRFTPTLPNGTPGHPTYLSLSPTGQLVITAVPAFQQTT